MKKVIVFILTLAMLALVSCTKSLPMADYNCTAAQYSEDTNEHELRIYYPVIVGAENSDALNEKLRDAAVSYMENYLTYNAPNGYYTYEIGTVTATLQLPELVSFLCIGSCYSESAPHPETIVYTLNMDPRDGSFYEFDELISDFDLLAKKFTDGKFDQISGAEDLIDQISLTDMFTQYSSLYKIYPPLYFIADDNDVLLAFSVELVYSLGGHAEFAIDTDDVKKAIGTQLSQIIYN